MRLSDINLVHALMMSAKRSALSSMAITMKHRLRTGASQRAATAMSCGDPPDAEQ